MCVCRLTWECRDHASTTILEGREQGSIRKGANNYQAEKEKRKRERGREREIEREREREREKKKKKNIYPTRRALGTVSTAFPQHLPGCLPKKFPSSHHSKGFEEMGEVMIRNVENGRVITFGRRRGRTRGELGETPKRKKEIPGLAATTLDLLSTLLGKSRRKRRNRPTPKALSLTSASSFCAAVSI